MTDCVSKNWHNQIIKLWLIYQRMTPNTQIWVHSHHRSTLNIYSTNLSSMETSMPGLLHHHHHTKSAPHLLQLGLPCVYVCVCKGMFLVFFAPLSSCLLRLMRTWFCREDMQHLKLKQCSEKSTITSLTIPELPALRLIFACADSKTAWDSPPTWHKSTLERNKTLAPEDAYYCNSN